MVTRMLLFVAAVLIAPSAGFAQWTAPVNISGTTGMFTTEPSYDFDSGGNIHMLFYDFMDTNYGIYYADNVGGMWSKSVLVWGAKYPILVVTPDDVMHAFYKKNGIWEVTRPVPGGAWSAPVRAADNPPESFPQDVIMDNTGGMYLIWYDLFDAGMAPNRSALWGRYKPLGGMWGPTELIYGTNDRDKWPMDGRLAFHNGRFYCSYIYNGAFYKVREPDGVWSSARSIPYAGSIGSIAFSPMGEMAVGYARDIAPRGQGLDYEVYVTTSNDLGATWSPEFCVSNSDWLSRAPMDVAYDQMGNLHITWQRNDYDGQDFDMWYRCRIGGVWQDAVNLTNNNTRSGARHSFALQIRGADLHYMFTDTAGPDGLEDVYYVMKPGPQDHTPPGPVTRFIAAGGENRVMLSWHAPTDPDYMATMVRVSTDGYPSGPFMGTYVCSKTASPGSTCLQIVYPLAAGVRYFFSAFAQDTAGNWSVAATATVVPLTDSTPPARVDSFKAAPYTSGNVLLSWTNPADIDFKGAIVCYRTDRYPMSAADGALVCNRVAAPGSADSFVHDGLTLGVRYYYAAFSYDHDANYASGAIMSGVPVDPTCAFVKQQPDNAPVELNGKVVTAIFPDEACFYIAEPDRTSGIRIAGAGSGLAIGDVVDVTGTVSGRIVSGCVAERQIVPASVTPVSQVDRLLPLALACRAVGGAACGLSPGVLDGIGVNNMGCLVRVSGRVTLVIGSYIYVDDGSSIQDVSGRVGVMVRSPSAPVVTAGSIVSVTGIVEGSVPTGWSANRRYIRMRDSDDLTVVSTGLRREP